MRFPFHRARTPSVRHRPRPAPSSPRSQCRVPTCASTVSSSSGAVRLRLSAPASPAQHNRCGPLSRPSRRQVAMAPAGLRGAAVRRGAASVGRCCGPCPVRLGRAERSGASTAERRRGGSTRAAHGRPGGAGRCGSGRFKF